MFEKKSRNELAPPPAATGEKDSHELLRAWIVRGDLHVSLQQGFDEPEAWGLILVDIARHASRIYAREGLFSEADAIARIRAMWAAELSSPTDLGSTKLQG